MSGSVVACAAYDLIAVVKDFSASVDVVVTPAAMKFVPDGLRAYGDEDWVHEPLHISLTSTAECMVVAPASMNSLTKMSLGLADNLLLASFLAATCPRIVFPATNRRMWEKTPSQISVERLRNDGVMVFEPIPALALGAQNVGDAVAFDEECLALALALL
jgi:phosphopantothenoylcysteine decarboxylase/phosphopantothenate--cysteine ligase